MGNKGPRPPKQPTYNKPRAISTRRIQPSRKDVIISNTTVEYNAVQQTEIFVGNTLTETIPHPGALDTNFLRHWNTLTQAEKDSFFDDGSSKS